MADPPGGSDKPVWIYVIFRKNRCSGHEKFLVEEGIKVQPMTVNLSVDGPVFWTRQVAYIYLCSCHFHDHEGPLMALMKKFEERVERVCMVDHPVDFPFLPDSIFRYMALCMPRLQFVYMRELDLEKINRGTVVEFATHKNLKKLIVHMCRNYEVLEDFGNLPQLLVVKGEIIGLKAMLGGDIDTESETSQRSDEIKTETPSSESSSEKNSEKGSELDLTEIRTALEVADEFEARIRRWRQLKFGFGETVHSRRSTSQEPRQRESPIRERQPRKPLPICATSPLPRKNMDHNGMSPLNFSDRLIDTASEEVNRRFEIVRNQSGLLRLNGQNERCNYSDLVFMEDIGHGSCGHVLKMHYKGHVMAVKQMARTGNADVSRRILMDLDVVLRCNSPHIVVCYGFFITDSTVYVCMELMATCLDRFLARINHRPVPERYIGKMTVSIIAALNYLKEEMRIIHRDVKPSNILLDWDGNVKLCDFGIAGQLIESKVFTRNAGCPPYMAPERFNIQPDANGMAPYDVRSDVWSIGITLVELARGKYPYPGGSEFEILTALLQMPAPSLSVEEGFSPEFCDFVKLCLNKDVEQRPKYDGLMQHPFYQRSLEDNVDLGEWFQEHMSCEE